MAVAINIHMLNWIAKTDGVNGEFINAAQPPSGNSLVIMTAGGLRLAGDNGPNGASGALEGGLARWKKLPEAERRALPEGKSITPPEAVRCTPPSGGLVLRSYVRNMGWDNRGELARIRPTDLKDGNLFPSWSPIYTEPAPSSVWLTEAEWKSLVPARPREGDRFRVPDPIEKRLLRYHLVNRTFGLAGPWSRDHIRSGELTLTVEATAPVLRLRLEGRALLTTDADPTKADRGYDARLLGWLEYDPGKKCFTRVDLVAVGDYWGGDYEGGRFKRPGRTPLGIAFELSQGDSALDRIPPLAHMDRKETYEAYFAAEKK